MGLLRGSGGRVGSLIPPTRSPLWTGQTNIRNSVTGEHSIYYGSSIVIRNNKGEVAGPIKDLIEREGMQRVLTVIAFLAEEHS